MNQRLGYVPALDGIRALAIVMVLLFHAYGLRGGWLGVDIFFVLSGFLITTLLLEEHERSGTVSLRDFYRRRVLRLLPALFAVLTVASIAVFEISGVRRAAVHGEAAIVGCLFYAGNLIRASGHQLPGDIRQLWSLGEEEQFYVLWPLLLLFFLRRRVRLSRLVVGLLSVAAAVAVWRLRLVVDGAAPDRVFFAPDTRADPLLIGCALAAVRFRSGLPSKAGGARSLAGLAILLLLAVACGGHGLSFAAGVTVAEVATVWVIVGALSPGSAVARLLSLRPVVWVGSISYGLYVWQGVGLTWFGHDTVGLSASVLIAAGSYRWMEAPFLRMKTRPRLAVTPIVESPEVRPQPA